MYAHTENYRQLHTRTHTHTVRDDNNDEDDDKENEPYELTEDSPTTAPPPQGEPTLPDILPGERSHAHTPVFHTYTHSLNFLGNCRS